MRDAFGVEHGYPVSKAWNPIKALKGLRGAKEAAATVHAAPSWADDPLRGTMPAAPKRPEPPKPTRQEWSGDGKPVGYRYGGHESAYDHVKRMETARHKGVTLWPRGGGGTVTGTHATAHTDAKTGGRYVLIHNKGGAFPSQRFNEDQIHSTSFDRL